MRNRQSTLINFGGPPWQENFPSFLNSGIGSGPTNINRSESTFLTHETSYTNTGYDAGAGYGAPASSIINDTIYLDPSSLTPVIGGVSYSGPYIPMYPPQSSILVDSYVRTTGGFFNVARTFYKIDISITTGLIFYTLRAPYTFLTSDSYYILEDSPTVERDPLLIISALDDVASYHSQVINVTIPDQNRTVTGVGATATANMSITLNLNHNPNYMEYKLLTEADAVLCNNLPLPISSSLTKSFFDSLASPTLGEAISLGGCDYWGIIKYSGFPFSTIEPTIDLESSADGILGQELSNSIRFDGTIAGQGLIAPYDTIITDDSTPFNYDQTVDGGIFLKPSDHAEDYSPLKNTPQICLKFK